MTRKRKSWREKLADSKDLPKLEPMPENLRSRWGEGTLLIPAPIEVDRVMRRVRKGRLTTIAEIRSVLASEHGATIACPLCSGIFSWIAAWAADEDEAEGKKRITPYWRTLKAGGELNPKYPGGIDGLRARLEAEGHEVRARGKRWFVDDLERALVEPRA